MSDEAIRMLERTGAPRHVVRTAMLRVGLDVGFEVGDFVLVLEHRDDKGQVNEAFVGVMDANTIVQTGVVNGFTDDGVALWVEASHPWLTCMHRHAWRLLKMGGTE